MTVQITEKALKELSKLSKKESSKILDKIEKLEDFPNLANIKKLTNFNPPYRLRVGDYRILFDVSDNNITVYAVKHRKESYQ
jgi:mRNA interferase RelE/StbE